MPSVVIDVVVQAPDEVLVQVRGIVDRAGVGDLRRHLTQIADAGAAAVVVDMSAVERCDLRVLAVLDDIGGRMDHAHRRFEVRGLHPRTLTGFAQASLGEVLAAYRASPGVAQPRWPVEPGRARAAATCSSADRRLIQACVALATPRGRTAQHPDTHADTTADMLADMRGVGDRLIELCLRRLGVDAAALLVPSDRGPGAGRVMSVSAMRARLLAEADLATGEGPAVSCFRHGQPVSAPDLADWGRRWPRYVTTARQHGLHAARALPLRPPTRPAQPDTLEHPSVIGVLVVFSESPGPVAPADLEVAQAFADLAALPLAAILAAERTRHVASELGSGFAAGAARLADQIVIEQATGALADRDQSSTDQAHTRLLGIAQTRDLHPAEVARAIISGASARLDPILIPPVPTTGHEAPAGGENE